MRVIEKADIEKLEPLLCSIKAGEAILGHSERFIIDQIAKGRIKAVKSGRRTLLIVESVKQYVKSLPPAKGTINPPRHPLMGHNKPPPDQRLR